MKLAASITQERPSITLFVQLLIFSTTQLNFILIINILRFRIFQLYIGKSPSIDIIMYINSVMHLY